MSPKNRRDTIAEYRQQFAAFAATKRESISWHVNGTRRVQRSKPTGRNTSTIEIIDAYDSNYAYAVTWTPGTLVLSGDIGELTITHWHAMPTLLDTIDWLRAADHEYLMGKSSAKREYDQEETLAWIILSANEQAGDSMKALREEMQEYRRSLADDPDPEGLHRPAPLACRDNWAGRAWKSESKRDRYEAPDGWELWHALRQETCDWRDVNSIFTIAGRQAIKSELEKHLETAHEAADLCQKIGLDDYYGSERWPHQTYVQFAAIQHWVTLADAEYFPTAAARVA